MHEPDRGHDSGGEPSWKVIAGGRGDREPSGPPPPGRWRGRSARTRAVTVGAAVVALALGGTVAYAANDGGSVPVSTGSSASPSPGHGDRHGPGSGRFFGIGAMDGHGESTVKDRESGKWVVRVWQRGTVEKVDGGKVDVKSGDGVTWTWTVGSDTRVRGDHASGTGAAALKKGDTALLAGTRSGDTRTARIAVVGTFDHMRGGHREGHGPWDRPGHTPSENPSNPSNPSDDDTAT